MFWVLCLCASKIWQEMPWTVYHPIRGWCYRKYDGISHHRRYISSVVISEVTSVLKHAASLACDRAEDADSDENISDSGGESYSVWNEYE